MVVIAKPQTRGCVLNYYCVLVLVREACVPFTTLFIVILFYIILITLKTEKTLKTEFGDTTEDVGASGSVHLSCLMCCLSLRFETVSLVLAHLTDISLGAKL